MVSLFRWQNRLYLERNEKFIIVPAGRRTGKTQGASISACIDAIKGKKVLWVDTIYSNIDRYYDRYFSKALKEMGIEFSWNSQKKILKVGEGYIDFRSADKPENIEGFGYHKIYLNEAGIILNKDYLYTNAILPMMLDFKESQLIAFGTPKGKTNKDGNKHRFYQLWENVLNKVDGYYGETLSSYSNPLLDEDNLKSLENEINKLDPNAIPQEIYGEFVDAQEGALFNINELNTFELKELNREVIDAKVSYIDVASGGLDYTCMVYAELIGGNVYVTDVVMSKADSNYTIPACRNLLLRTKANYCQVETNNAGKIFLNELTKGIQKTALIPLHNSTNKETRITNSAFFIKSKVYFRNDYEVGSEYHEFMKQILSFNVDKKLNKHDDAPDALAGLVGFIHKYYAYYFDVN